MPEFHFLRPYWLLTILPIVFIWLGFLRKQDELAKLKDIIDSHLIEHLLVGEKKNRWLKPLTIIPLLLALTAVALAGPSFRQESAPFIGDQAGLMILLKANPTMSSKDVQPSRLSRAKHKIKDLIEHRSGGTTGLIVYSGSAHLVMPPTRDDRIINMMIEELTPDLMPVEGDALAIAIALGEDIIGQTGQPGSLLVVADSVAPGQPVSRGNGRNSLPVQFLSMLAPGTNIDSNLQQFASALGAGVTELTVDTSDVERIARRAKSSFASIGQDQEGQRWRDEGYWLLPFIAFFSLLWFRKGWVVR